MILNDVKVGEDDEPDASEGLEPIALRTERRSVTGCCVQCGEEFDEDRSAALYLTLNFADTTYIALCHEHEIELTEKLVKRYVRRLRKGKEKLLLDKDPDLGEDDDDLEEFTFPSAEGITIISDEGCS